MTNHSSGHRLGVIGAGAMGSGIAQVAASAGWEVLLFDQSLEATQQAISKLSKILNRLVEKRRLQADQKDDILHRIKVVESIQMLESCDLIIEAIIENLDIKKKVFNELESIVNASCILASNTSSLSITSIAGATDRPERVIGLHFFNPPGLMKLVEIIPGHLTSGKVLDQCKSIIHSWNKVGVIAKDTPGFIVNKIARPFYSEALRLYDEGIAGHDEIDWVMTTLGGFRMGPFTLMDYIGHDVNYAVTESVWKAFYYEPRYKPSLSQMKLTEAGLLGKKSGRGFYDYLIEDQPLLKEVSKPKAQEIFSRIICMLINEAADTVYYGICTEEDADLAMTKGVNYPKGLLAWGNELGWNEVAKTLNNLYTKYKEERYRISPYILNKIPHA